MWLSTINLASASAERGRYGGIEGISYPKRFGL